MLIQLLFIKGNYILNYLYSNENLTNFVVNGLVQVYNT